jgi:hypothetical protein
LSGSRSPRPRLGVALVGMATWRRTSARTSSQAPSRAQLRKCLWIADQETARSWGSIRQVQPMVDGQIASTYSHLRHSGTAVRPAGGSDEQVAKALPGRSVGRTGNAGAVSQLARMFASVAFTGYDPGCHAAHLVPVRACPHPRAGGDAGPARRGIQVRLQPVPSAGHRCPCQQADRPTGQRTVVGV